MPELLTRPLRKLPFTVIVVQLKVTVDASFPVCVIGERNNPGHDVSDRRPREGIPTWLKGGTPKSTFSLHPPRQNEAFDAAEA
jgi:hypothetical protein